MDKIVNFCSCHRSILSLNSWLVWVGALSITNTVGRSKACAKRSMQATTTAVVTLCSNTHDWNGPFLFIKPNTFRRLLLAQGTPMVFPTGCQAQGMQGSRVKPDSSK